MTEPVNPHFIPHSQREPGEFSGRYTLSSDDWVGYAGSLVIAPWARRAFDDQRYASHWGDNAFAFIAGRDETGRDALLMECDDDASASAIITSARASRCQECGEPLGDEPVVFPAASDLAWNFHYRCCDDPDPAARRADVIASYLLPE
jgi:hypothetical protein